MPKQKNIRVNFTVLTPGGHVRLGQCTLKPELTPELAGFEAGKAIAKLLRKTKMPPASPATS